METLNILIKIIAFIILIVLRLGLPILLFIIIRKKINSIKLNNYNNTLKSTVINSNKYKKIYKDIDKDILNKFNTDDLDGLKDTFYDIFIKFEKAYNDLDYQTMKAYSSKEIYENYYTGIKLNLNKGNKKIIKDIKKEKLILFDLKSTSIKQSASILVEISYVTYTIDKNGNLISGDMKPINEKFEIEFKKYHNTSVKNNCPSCGAILNGNQCEFCKYVVPGNNFYINSIRKVLDN